MRTSNGNTTPTLRERTKLKERRTLLTRTYLMSSMKSLMKTRKTKSLNLNPRVSLKTNKRKIKRRTIVRVRAKDNTRNRVNRRSSQRIFLNTKKFN